MKITNKYLIGIAAMLGLLSVVAVPAFAATNQSSGENSAGSTSRTYSRSGMMGARGANGQNMGPGIFGIVASVSGNTLTVNGRAPGMMAQGTTTYTVNATNATVFKNNATSTISAVLVGDTVSVRGTVTGTSVVATSIRDGLMMRGPGYVGSGVGKGNGEDKRSATSTWTGEDKRSATSTWSGEYRRSATSTRPIQNLSNKENGGSIGQFFKHLFGF